MIRACLASLGFLLLTACVSSAEDYETAKQVGKFLDATSVVPSDARDADKSHKGKIVYFAPGRNGEPHFTYYEVTDPGDMEKLRNAAEQALGEIPAARKISLHFMEKQVFHESGNGGGYRGREHELKTIVVQRSR